MTGNRRRSSLQPREAGNSNRFIASTSLFLAIPLRVSHQDRPDNDASSVLESRRIRKTPILIKMAASDWQKSLRRSMDAPGPAKPPFRSGVAGHRVAAPAPAPARRSEAWPSRPSVAAARKPSSQLRRGRVLSIVQEDVAVPDPADGENVPPARKVIHQGRKGSRASRSSLSDITNDATDHAAGPTERDEDVFVVHESSKPALKAPTKKDQSFLLAIPSYAAGNRSPQERTPLVSPVPLPEGVVCLDPDDGSEQSYGEDAVTYSRWLESFGDLDRCRWAGSAWTSRRQKMRALLVDWLMEVVHHFRGSQETLYQTVHLVDRFLNAKAVESGRVQLVGVACVLIATKLEEYFAADVRQLSALCKNAFKPKEIIRMELDILAQLSFKVYTVDPMIFVHRYIKAALREDDKMFYEAAIFFMDSFLSSDDLWAIRPSKKAAAAVYAALHLIPNDSVDFFPDDDNLWTRNLQYHTQLREDQIILMARQMLDVLRQVVEKSSSEDGDCGLRNKYVSVSRHHGFLNTRYCSVDHVIEVIHSVHARNQEL